MSGISQTISSVVFDLRSQLSKQGEHAIRRLETAFAVNDTDSSSFFDFDELQEVLRKCGLFVKLQNLSEFFRHLDKSKSKKISYHDFLNEIKVPLSDARARVVDAVYDKLSKIGAVTLQSLKASYDPSRHPKVLSGQRSRDQMFQEFAAALEGFASPTAPLTRDHVAVLFTEISACTVLDDAFFVRMVENVFGVKQKTGVSADVLEQLKKILREKLRQRTSTTATESETLRKTMKYYDLQESGLIDLKGFREALSGLGLVAPDHVMAALYSSHTGEDGLVNYAEFAASLFDRYDPLSASFATIVSGAAANRTREMKTHVAHFVEDSSVLLSAQEKHSSSLRRAQAEASKVKVLFVVGGPGSGKKTQADLVAQEIGCGRVSVGECLRALAESEHPSAGDIASTIKAGELVPSHVAVAVLKTALEDVVKQGATTIVVDGFPRTAEQYLVWKADPASKEYRTDLFIYLDTPDQIMEQRVLARVKSSPRLDDTAPAVNARFRLFREHIPLVMKQLSPTGLLRVASGAGASATVFEYVRKLISPLITVG